MQQVERVNPLEELTDDELAQLRQWTDAVGIQKNPTEEAQRVTELAAQKVVCRFHLKSDSTTAPVHVSES
jgi:hypothetical protein